MSKKNYKKVVGNDPNDKPIGTNRETVQKESKTYWEREYKSNPDLLFGKKHFIFIGIGLALIIIGFFLMSGGAMPDENTWDPAIIFSTTRITLSPILVLSGLGIVGYAIFYNPKEEESLSVSESESEEK